MNVNWRCTRRRLPILRQKNPPSAARQQRTVGSGLETGNPGSECWANSARSATLELRFGPTRLLRRFNLHLTPVNLRRHVALLGRADTLKRGGGRTWAAVTRYLDSTRLLRHLNDAENNRNQCDGDD